MGKALKLLLCSIASKYIHSTLAPWYLLAAVTQGCGTEIRADLMEATINEKEEGILLRICAGNPDVVAFSCYIWNIELIQRLTREVKERLPDAVILWGGPEVSFHPEELLRSEPCVDYILSGEGEKPLPLLLNALSQKTPLASIPGVCFRTLGGSHCSSPYFSQEDPPDPYTESYFKALNGRIAYLETSRGCPFSCAFCLSERGTVRYFDLNRSKNDLLRLASSGTKTVKLVDRTFNANKKRAAELFTFLIQSAESGLIRGVRFHFELAGDLLDEHTVALLSKAPAGLIQLEIGLQSFNPKALDAVNRKTNTGLLKKNIKKLTEKGNLHIHLDLIAGLPYEDLESFASSFNTAYALKPNMLQLGFLKLLHGAPMRAHPEQYPCLFNEKAPYEVIKTPWLSDSELMSLHHTEDAFDRLYNSGRFRRTLRYLLNRTKLPPFTFFQRCGKFLAAKQISRISLNDLISLLYDFFRSLPQIDQALLRDLMVCDYLSTNASGKLPPALQIPDPALGQLRRRMKAEGQKPFFKNALALLYFDPCTVFADYTQKNPVTGEYPLTFQAASAPAQKIRLPRKKPQA